MENNAVGQRVGRESRDSGSPTEALYLYVPPAILEGRSTPLYVSPCNVGVPASPPMKGSLLGSITHGWGAGERNCSPSLFIPLFVSLSPSISATYRLSDTYIPNPSPSLHPPTPFYILEARDGTHTHIQG